MSGRPLTPIVVARTPAGVPICGALRVQGTSSGYPIIDSVARLTPYLAWRHREWLSQMSLEPPQMAPGSPDSFQGESTVESFGWQWTWNSNMRSEADLRMRVLDRFGLQPQEFVDEVVLDAGAGAGDQSRYMLQQGAAVVSIDLSSAIEVVSQKLRMNSRWVGVQGDITSLPFESGQFDIVYCEGVIQHTKDSLATVRELCRVARAGGRVLASHYVRTPADTSLKRLKRKLTLGYYEYLRARLSRMDRYRLQLVTGIVSALSYLPLIGSLLRRSSTVLHYDLMPDFKTTWTNTFDYYGNHSYQRIITPQEFWDYFEAVDTVEMLHKGSGVVVARKVR